MKISKLQSTPRFPSKAPQNLHPTAMAAATIPVPIILANCALSTRLCFPGLPLGTEFLIPSNTFMTAPNVHTSVMLDFGEQFSERKEFQVKSSAEVIKGEVYLHNTPRDPSPDVEPLRQSRLTSSRLLAPSTGFLHGNLAL